MASDWLKDVWAFIICYSGPQRSREPNRGAHGSTAPNYVYRVTLLWTAALLYPCVQVLGDVRPDAVQLMIRLASPLTDADCELVFLSTATDQSW